MKKSIIAAVLGTALLSTTAIADQLDVTGPTSGDLDWNGSIESACGLQSFVDGIVTANINQDTLSSTFSGGEVASVNVRTNTDGYTLVLGEPKLLDADTEEDISQWAASFDIDASATGVDLMGNNTGTVQQDAMGDIVFEDAGSYEVEADATVYANLKGGFPAGDYIVRVPVTCVLETSTGDSTGQCGAEGGNCGNGGGNGGGNGTDNEGNN